MSRRLLRTVLLHALLLVGAGFAAGPRCPSSPRSVARTPSAGWALHASGRSKLSSSRGARVSAWPPSPATSSSAAIIPSRSRP